MHNIDIPQNPDERSKYVRNLFDSITGTYDTVNTVLSAGLDQIWRKKMIQLADVPINGKVLDLCTGTGKVVFDFAKWSKASEIIGLDFSFNMIELAKKDLERKKNKFNPKQINFLQGDAVQLPFPENYFDSVTSAFGLRNVVSLEKYFTEKYRVTKSDGKNLTLELTRPVNILIRGMYYPYLHIYLPTVGRLISGNSYAYQYLAKTISEFYSPEKILDYMRKAGWKEVQAIPLTGGITTIFYGIK